MRMDLITRWWGPVFEAERITRSRRWQGYAVRSLFVLILLGGLALCWAGEAVGVESMTVAQLAQFGSRTFDSLFLLEVVAVLIIAPAATAGAICQDKASGALAHAFVTDLTDREIVLGKLAARLGPVLGLIACSLPVLALTTLLGGVDPMKVGGAILIVGGLAVLGCSVALLLSVWASRPHEVISVVYGVWAVWVFAWPTWIIVCQIVWGGASGIGWLGWTNPFFYVYQDNFAVAMIPPVYPAWFALGCLVVGAGCVTVAIGKVRVVGCRSSRPRAGRVGRLGRLGAWVRGQVRWGRGPELDADPVGWREWHRNRPSRWTRVVWLGYGMVNATVCLILIVTVLLNEFVLNMSELTVPFLALLATLGLLFVAAAAPSVLAEERARGSLDVLISTPIATRAILRAKWWGAFRRVPGLAIGPTAVIVVFAAKGRPSLVELATAYCLPLLIVVQGAALVSLGLALATWIKRTGTATAWTVALLVAALIGGPILGESLSLADLVGLESGQTYQDLPVAGSVPVGTTVLAVPIGEQSLAYMLVDDSLSMGSPFYNIIVAFVSASGGTQSGREALATLILAIAWTVIYALIAWGLYETTVRTFDRCLGRAPERPRSPRVEPTAGRSRLGLVRGWGWRTLARGGRRAGHAASCGPRPR